MADKTITFTQGVKYDTLPPVYYTAGQKVTLREDIADRWLRRGVATEAGEGKSNAVEALNPDDPVEIPAGWRTMLAAEKIDLAKALGAKDEDVTTGVAAMDFIDAEAKKRDDAAK